MESNVELSNSQYQQLINMFKMIDVDNDGKITVSEFEQSLKGPELAAVLTLMDKVDRDQDGRIDVHEFVDLISSTVNVKKNEAAISDELQDSVRKLFGKMDNNGNGYVLLNEFALHLQNQGIMMGKNSVSALYEIIRSHGPKQGMNKKGFTYQNLLNYIAEENHNHINQADLNANFDNVSNLDDLLTVAAVKGIDLNQDELIELAQTDESEFKESMKGLLRKKSTRKIDTASEEIRRWQPFVNFRRRANRKTIMCSPNKLIKDVLPGQYNLASMVQFSDLPPLHPMHAEIKGCFWIDGEDGKPGQLIFPSSFDGKIPTDIATSETLGYYGAKIAEATKDFADDKANVFVSTRQAILDFTYDKNYYETWVLGQIGGPGLEYHEFHHLDCPLQQDSGYWLLAKWADEDQTELHVTAFTVPVRHTLYTPGGVLHTNNFLKGTWRTMLADGPIHEAKMMRNDEPLKIEITSD